MGSMNVKSKLMLVTANRAKPDVCPKHDDLEQNIKFCYVFVKGHLSLVFRDLPSRVSQGGSSEVQDWNNLYERKVRKRIMTIGRRKRKLKYTYHD